ncbi:LOW QUALITY PROTEIN: ABC transporter G family member 3-like [Camellia sinensis]|uniref:LOW QUALITY PROTEIN: ABC transporter G family member 3-like n=1 Tax=Camellia sinensis TaxID=4442 RepID=UPI001036C08A|nr:LOW QUALITY PROTEIN: ABC transporter G family member 3-like [Camellia sinensis]
MEEIQSQSDNYRSPSSSASSPVSGAPSSNFFYMRKPGSVRQPISFEDSPDWEDTDVDVRVEERGDSIDAATTPASPTFSKRNSGSLPSPPLPEGAVVARKVAGASVAWKDLTVTINGKRKYSNKVVKSSNGYTLPGTITVIMGPAKSGKSTLLRALAGRLHDSAKMYGEVFVNGVKSRLPYGSYFVNFDVALPLYHLDSVSALLMMVTLKKLANTGCTLIFTIYQSSTEVFGLFDRICLLSNGNTLFFGETLACLQHFSNAGFPCPIMQSPSDHFLRAINTDFDRIIAMCKNWQDDQGDFSSVNVDTAIAIRTLEATYKSSADATAVETMILKLTEKEGSSLKSKGKASIATRIAVLTWRSLLIMSREWKYYWLRLILYMLLTVCIGTVFSGLGHSLSSVMTRVAAIFVFISFTSLLSIAGVPAQAKEIKIYACEQSNQHTGAFVFLLGQLLSSIPFLFLISVSSSVAFYFFIGLQDQFSLLMYFVLNFFICLLVNEGLMLSVVTISQDVFWSILTLVCIHVIMMLSAGYFRIRSALPGPVWMYPVSYIAFHTYSIKGLLENEYIGTSFAVGQVRSISGYQALRSAYDVSPDGKSKWQSLLWLSLMAVGYRILVFVLLQFHVRKNLPAFRFFQRNQNTNNA